MNLIDIRQVVTQILGFLLFVWILKRVAWGPLLGMLEQRRQAIVGKFQEADQAKAQAEELRLKYEQDLRGIDAQARQRIQQAVVEGQQVAAEIRTQAQSEAQGRMLRAEDDIAREREKAKEILKEQMIHLAIRGAEKILRQKLDDATQRKLVGEFIDEAGALR